MDLWTLEASLKNLRRTHVKAFGEIGLIKLSQNQALPQHKELKPSVEKPLAMAEERFLKLMPALISLIA